MKTSRVVALAALALVLAGCAQTLTIVNAQAVPKDRPLYGYTREGVFFIHESLIANVRGNPPVFASEVTMGDGRRMILKDGYYTYDVARSSRDSTDFTRYNDSGVAIRYFFVVGTNVQIPRDIMGLTNWIGDSDVINDNGIPVFATHPVDNRFIH